METSENVYNILTDHDLNTTKFTISYYDVIKKSYIDIPILQFIPIKNGGVIS